MKAEDLKLVVQEKYSAIANQGLLINQPKSFCCGELEFSMICDEYKNVEGYNPEADSGLSGGLPTQFADLKVDDHVLGFR
jgi:arsenite methyltransferase